MVKPNELLHKGSGIKAVFSLAPLPRRPCMGESPCSLGGGVDSSNHQFPRQTDRGQDTGGRHPTALGLTVADRWECSQATGLPAWRHQDLSTSQPLGHTVSRALKDDNLYLGTGPDWTLCMYMYTATQGACVFRFVSRRGGETVRTSVMG